MTGSAPAARATRPSAAVERPLMLITSAPLLAIVFLVTCAMAGGSYMAGSAASIGAAPPGSLPATPLPSTDDPFDDAAPDRGRSSRHRRRSRLQRAGTEPLARRGPTRARRAPHRLGRHPQGARRRRQWRAAFHLTPPPGRDRRADAPSRCRRRPAQWV